MQLLSLAGFLVAVGCMRKTTPEDATGPNILTHSRQPESRLKESSTELEVSKFPELIASIEEYTPATDPEFVTGLGYKTEVLSMHGRRYLAVHERFKHLIYNSMTGERFFKYVEVTGPNGYKEIFFVGDVHAGGAKRSLDVVMMLPSLRAEIRKYDPFNVNPQITVTPLYGYNPGCSLVLPWADEHPKGAHPGLPYVLVPSALNPHHISSVLMSVPKFHGLEIALSCVGKTEEKDVFYVDMATFKTLELREGDLAYFRYGLKKDLKAHEGLYSLEEPVDLTFAQRSRLGAESSKMEQQKPKGVSFNNYSTYNYKPLKQEGMYPMSQNESQPFQLTVDSKNPPLFRLNASENK